ncbi:hypothetical protein [Pseudolabrys sp. FHR47]|uniref:hypothetical protein n=1 Tax=Pseudolabrys sp. FHR47 TaxID=2562284 RepID=UPI0010BEEAD4|nr:hypothetical protein [Pseudolabrys sp. FHR47]
MLKKAYEAFKKVDPLLSLGGYIWMLFGAVGLTGAVAMGWLTSQLTWFWATFQWAGVLFISLLTWLLIGIGLNLYRHTGGTEKRPLDPWLIVAAVATIVVIASLVAYAVQRNPSRVIQEPIAAGTASAKKQGDGPIMLSEFEWGFERHPGYPYIGMMGGASHNPAVVFQFRAQGHNRTKDPISNAKAYIRSDRSGAIYPGFFNIKGNLFSGDEINPIPVDAIIDIHAYFDPDKKPISIETLLNEIAPITFFFDYDGKQYRRSFSHQEIEVLVRRSEQEMKPQVTPPQMSPKKESGGVSKNDQRSTQPKGQTNSEGPKPHVQQVKPETPSKPHPPIAIEPQLREMYNIMVKNPVNLSTVSHKLRMWREEYNQRFRMAVRTGRSAPSSSDGLDEIRKLVSQMTASYADQEQSLREIARRDPSYSSDLGPFVMNAVISAQAREELGNVLAQWKYFSTDAPLNGEAINIVQKQNERALKYIDEINQQQTAAINSIKQAIESIQARTQ